MICAENNGITQRIARTVRGGFSLIEILIAIAIIAVMGVTLVPGLLNYLNKAKVTRAKTELKTIAQGIDMYHADTNQYPATLKDLVRRPADEKISKKWQEGTYLGAKEVPSDPWGTRYVYQVTEGKEHPYELYSYGKNLKGAPKSEWLSVWDNE
jgi:general secretion pathway protein G